MKNITLLALGIFIGAVGIVYVIGPLSAGKTIAVNPTPSSVGLTPVASPNASQVPGLKPTPSPIASGKSSPIPSPANSTVPTPVPSPVPTPSKPALTKSEVSKHSTQNNCYIIINNKVYDISNYFGSHPGGDSIMLGYCGAEASTIFSAIHSNFAWDLLSKYLIGNLVAG